MNLYNLSKKIILAFQNQSRYLKSSILSFLHTNTNRNTLDLQPIPKIFNTLHCHSQMEDSLSLSYVDN